METQESITRRADDTFGPKHPAEVAAHMKLRRSLRSLVMEAYSTRYSFERVSIAKDGQIVGHWPERHGSVPLGNIADCAAKDNGRRTGVQVYNGSVLVYTFGPEVARWT